MGTRKRINLRISGSRVLGRLKKSCKCCGNPDIYAIHLLPTAYPSKKLANSREQKKRKQTNSKNSFSPSPCFICFLLLLFSYSIFFSLSSILTSNLYYSLP